MSAHGVPKPPRWTPEEDRVVEAHYPAGGVAACQARLPQRSALAIYNRAHRLEVSTPVNRCVLRFGRFGGAATEQVQQYAPEGVDQVLRAWTARRHGGAA